MARSPGFGGLKHQSPGLKDGLAGLQSPSKHLLKLRLKDFPRDNALVSSPQQAKPLSLYDRKPIDRQTMKPEIGKESAKKQRLEGDFRRRTTAGGQPSYLAKVKEILSSRKATAKLEGDPSPRGQPLFSSLLETDVLRMADLQSLEPSAEDARIRFRTRASEQAISAAASPLHFASVSWREVEDCSLGTLDAFLDQPSKKPGPVEVDSENQPSQFCDTRLGPLLASVGEAIAKRDQAVAALSSANSQLRHELAAVTRDRDRLALLLAQHSTLNGPSRIGPN